MNRLQPPAARRPRLSRLLLALAAAVALVLPSSVLAQAPGAVAGRVRDAFTGRPVAGVEVRLVPLFDPEVVFASAVTSAAGRYRIGRVAPGDYHVYAATSAGYVGELPDGTPCYDGLRFNERFGYNCGGDPPVIEVAARRTVALDFALDLGGAIAGRVTSAATGEPLAAVQVVVSSPRGQVFDDETTGADGRYRVRGLPAGGYRVSTVNGAGLADEVHDGIHCDGRLNLVGACDPRLGTQVGLALRREVTIDFALEKLGTLAGRVTDAASGAALPEIDVTVWRSDDLLSFSARSGADGRYRIGGLFASEYRVTTRNAGGWVDELFDDVACVRNACYSAAGTPVAVAIGQVAEGIDFGLDHGGSISGSVTAEATGAPLDHVVIHLSSQDRVALYTFSTGADGRFHIDGLPTGSYLLHTSGAWTHGFADEAFDGEACGLREVFCDLALATPVPVALGEETVGIAFTLEPLGEIAGTVTDEETGEPISGISVFIVDHRGRFTVAGTDAAGHYRGTRLPRGEYRVMTQGGGGRREFIDELYDGVRCFNGECDPRAQGTPVPVVSGATTGGVDLAVRRGAVIEGRVTRESDGQPAFARVFAADAGGRFVRAGAVDGDGFYRLPGLIDGDYYVVTAAGSFRLVDEVYDRNQCLHGTGLGCVPTEGAPVRVAIGAPPAVVDFALASGFRPGVPCRPSPTRLCLAGGRFGVGVRRFTVDEAGMARARPISDSAGAFTFFADDNLEAVVRVVDACAAFDRFWVLAASLSSLGLEAGVVDTVTGEARKYVNLDSGPTLDAAAFATCGGVAEGGSAAAPAASEAGAAGVATGEPTDGERAAGGLGAGFSAGVLGAAAPTGAATINAAAPASAAGSCVPGPSTLCLLSGRFAVAAEWDDGTGGGGAAGAVALGDRSGYLWFHRPGSPEVAIKALDACATARPGFWFFAAGLTDSFVELTITDTVSGEQARYVNPPGQPFTPIRDLARFDDCP